MNSSHSDDFFIQQYMADVSRFKPLSSQKELQLAKRIKKGDKKALGQLIKANLRFVVSVAKNYQQQGMSLIDLVNEGNLGLIKAAERFDPEKNFKFISYAVWWIRQSILQALAEQSRIVKVPLNRVGNLYKINKARIRLEQKFGRSPSIDEVARYLHIGPSEISSVMYLSMNHVSLDAPVGTEGDKATMYEVIEDFRGESPDENLHSDSFKQEIASLLTFLPEREAEILRMYFGIGSLSPQTLEEIGNHFGLTRERARQIKEKSLRVLRTYMKQTSFEFA